MDSVQSLVVWRGEGRGELSRSRVQSPLESRVSSCPRVLIVSCTGLCHPIGAGEEDTIPKEGRNPGFRSVSQAGVLLWILYFHRLSQRSRSCSLLPLFLPMHILTLLIQKRKNIRAQLTSVSFPSRALGKCSGFCQCLGVEDRVGSRAMLCHSSPPKAFWIFLRVPSLKFTALVAHSTFPCVLSTFLYFVGNWERAALGDALTHGLGWVLAVSAFMPGLYQRLWNHTEQEQTHGACSVLGLGHTSLRCSSQAGNPAHLARFRDSSDIAALPG